ncbi:tRNA pseudouridine(13) synthase TruD [Candidatus Woesearchaeota archaeon]|nr:tRNA pseudouridine(13) synthase TruD [Candidatus Woesearchaeota archaeon]
MLLKENSSDFCVYEIIDESLFSDEPTRTHLYILKKTNYTTERAVSQIARSLGVPRKFIGYAGTKDKNAVTEQLISIKGTNKEKVENLELKDIELKFAGYSHHSLALGDLIGNRFEIVIKELSKIPENIPEQFIVPNYFDEQRFSTNNVQVGLSLIKKDFKGAVEQIAETDEDFRDGIKAHLEKQPNDFVGAFRLLPRKITLFYIHALQSKLFNDLLAKRIDGVSWKYSQGEFKFFKEVVNKKPFDKLPLIGYLSKLDEEDKKVLEQFDIVARNFLITSLPDLSLEGSEREAFLEVKNCKEISRTDDSITLSFELGKGSYATIVIKQILAMNGIKDD